MFGWPQGVLAPGMAFGRDTHVSSGPACAIKVLSFILLHDPPIH